MEVLVGYTGFVGSNILKNHYFDKKFNSKNIEEAYELNPDLLVYSGISAAKFLANSNEEKDLEVIKNAFENIIKINPKKLVLISTIDVYENTFNKNEDNEPDSTSAYGKNRLYLEKLVKENIDDYTIIRLPALFGINLKKNFLYDLKNPIPNMINSTKFLELKSIDNNITKYYTESNDFYKINKLNFSEKKELINILKRLDYTSIVFTDSRAKYQFYNLNNLWNDINYAINNNIKLFNIATEPISSNEIYEYIYGFKYVNELPKEIPNYNMITKYSKKGYLYFKDQILKEIKDFINSNDIKLSISNIAWTSDDELFYIKMKELNYTGLEIAPSLFVGENPYDKIELAIDKYKTIKELYNLNISSIQSIWYKKEENIFNGDTDRKELLEYTKKSIDFAHSLDCKNIVFGCPKNRNIVNNLELDKGIKFLKDITEYATTKDVVIALEANPKIYNTNFVNTTIEALDLIKKINLPNFKLNLDLGTMIENNEIASIIKNNVNYINHVHISEPYLKNIEKRNIHLEILKILKEEGYNGYVSIEMNNKNNIDDVLKSMKYLKEIYEKI